jgi:hypothetical protein
MANFSVYDAPQKSGVAAVSCAAVIAASSPPANHEMALDGVELIQDDVRSNASNDAARVMLHGVVGEVTQIDVCEEGANFPKPRQDRAEHEVLLVAQAPFDRGVTHGLLQTRNQT